MFRDTLDSYRAALARWLPLLLAHGFIRLLTAAILVPVIGALMAVSLSFAGQSALTDQDIALFLLTPVGAVAGLVVVSLLIVAAVLDVAVMTVLLNDDVHRPLKSLQVAAGFLLAAAPRLVRFGFGLLLRVLLIAAPFLLAGAAVGLVLLGEFDINYYLTRRPPEFLTAVALLGAVGLAFGAVLLGRMTGWALALHLAVPGAMPVSRAFDESRRAMAGHRRAFLGRLVVWILLRAAAAAILGAVAARVVARLPDWFDDRLPAFLGAMIAVALGWSLAGAVLNAVANGALADLLNRQFRRAFPGRDIGARIAAAPSPLAPANLLLAAIALLSLAAIGTGGLLLESFAPKDRVVVIGHRGAAELRPENTLAAVRKAIEDGADWVEIDVQETADGAVIVAHDSDFMKSAGVPTKVWDVTAAELADIDIGSWFDPRYGDERPPLLRDVLAAAKDRAKVIIELKYYGHDVDLERRVIAIVEDAGMADQIATMSLKYPAVQKMRQLRPDWRTGVLAATAVGDMTGLEGDFLAVNVGAATARLVARAGAAGKDVYVWTVNDPGTMARMILLGADGLITDNPALAGEVIAFLGTLPTTGRLLLALGDWVGATFDFEPPAEMRP